MQFYTSLKNSKYVYFLLEYIKGIPLYNVIREIGKHIFINNLIQKGLLDRKTA